MSTKRRSLSGIFIFDTFEGEEKRQPTCLEDCREETRLEWLEEQDKETLVRTANLLCQVIRSLGDQFGIVSDYGESD